MSDTNKMLPEIWVSRSYSVWKSKIDWGTEYIRADLHAAEVNLLEARVRAYKRGDVMRDTLRNAIRSGRDLPEHAEIIITITQAGANFRAVGVKDIPDQQALEHLANLGKAEMDKLRADNARLRFIAIAVEADITEPEFRRQEARAALQESP